MWSEQHRPLNHPSFSWTMTTTKRLCLDESSTEIMRKQLSIKWKQRMKMLWRLIVVFMCWELTPVNTGSFSFLYSLINTWTTKHFPCRNLSVIQIGLLLYLHWPGMATSDLTTPAIKLFCFKLEENKGAIWSHVSVKLKWSSCQIKPTSTEMREKNWVQGSCVFFRVLLVSWDTTWKSFFSSSSVLLFHFV